MSRSRWPTSAWPKKRGVPRMRPPFPAVAGLYQSPTVLNNVETFCAVPPIILNGGQWFADLGTPKNGGTRLFCLSGHINKPGVYELPMGFNLWLVSGAAAQQQDTARVHRLNALVVIADRTATRLATSTSAASAITAAEIRARPARTLTEVLQQMPGLAFIDFDGLGMDPQIVVRGFYGGGETESVVLLRDVDQLKVDREGADYAYRFVEA